MAALSTQGLTVLGALAAGPQSVTALVRRVRRPGAALSVTRASLSRTLRRLWRDGLVELSDGVRSMSDVQRAHRARLATLEADPQAAYDKYRAFVESSGLTDRCGSADAYLRWQARRPLDLRVRTVHITAAGRSRLRAQVNRDAANHSVNHVAGRTS